VRRTRFALGLCFLAALAFARPADAASVTVQITGTWDSVADTAGVTDGSLVVGGAFVATLVYDDATDPDPEAPNDPNSSNYTVPAGSSDLTLSSGNYSFTPASALGISIDDDNAGQDAVYLFADSYTTPGISIGGTSYANPVLIDSSSAAHDSDALEDLPWSIDAYDLTNFYFFASVGTGGDYIELSGTISGLAVLPEPSGFALTGLALLALAGARRLG
jgi:hypothetical protein